MKFHNKPIIAYVPHGIDKNLFFPVQEGTTDYEEMLKVKADIFGKLTDKIEYILFFNSRNIRRKQIPDIIAAFKTFYDMVPDKDKIALLLHTQPVDDNGTDLPEVIKAIAPKCIIRFTRGLVDSKILNYFYNMCDATVCIGSNEGWGLSATESLMAGVPIIANVTGGLQDQMRFEDENGNWIDFSADFPTNHTGKYRQHGPWAIPVFPSNRSIQGSVPTPYISDDRVQFEDLANAFKQLYDMPKDFRKAKGELGRLWVTSDESMMTSENLGKNMIKNIDHLFSVWQPKKRFEIVLDKDYNFTPEHSGLLIDEKRINNGK